MSANRVNPNECDENASPSARFAEHVSQDQAQRDARNPPQLPENAEGVVGEFFDEATQEDYRSYRADELLRRIQQVESPREPYRCPAIPARLFDPVAPPTPAVSPTRNWVIDEEPRSGGGYRFHSFCYAFLPSLHLPPGVPFAPWCRPVPSRRVATCYFPQSYIPVPAPDLPPMPNSPPYRPIPYAPLSPEEPLQSPEPGDSNGEWSDSSFLEEDELGNSREEPETLSEDEETTQENSDVEQETTSDSEASNNPEGAAAANNGGMEAFNNPGGAAAANNGGMEAFNNPGGAAAANNGGVQAFNNPQGAAAANNGVRASNNPEGAAASNNGRTEGSDVPDRAAAPNNYGMQASNIPGGTPGSNNFGMGASGFGKYVGLLRHRQVQIQDDENSDENPNAESDNEESDDSGPPYRMFRNVSPKFDVDEEEVLNDNAPSFLHRLAGILSNVEELNRYDFDDENPMLELDDPFQEGLRRLEIGDIAMAVFCFEAAAQRESDNPLVWQYLGTTQAENEQDSFAISALRECLRLDPTNLTAMMTIAISFTNEGFPNAAVIMLWKWLYYNPNYSDLVLPQPPTVFWSAPSLLDRDTHEMVKELFLMAANKNPTGNLDPEVQCGLGVLFNLQHDCNKAADCFKAALSINPNDPIMWNRLGATLSNGFRSEESVGAYYRSLDMRPGYVRARYNLGVSFVNLGAYTEAIRHLIKSLYQQTRSDFPNEVVGRMSDTIVTTLKVVLNHIGREDLVAAVRTGNLQLVCEEFGLTLDGDDDY